MIAVSIIIPVYNSEKYLKECIDSLLAQTLPHCEFIFVNDGSQDNSQAILESYQKNDSRVILFNQENQGVSAARNKGLSLAKGKYVGFVDADDTIAPDFIAQLFSIAELHGVAIVISDFITEFQGRFICNSSVFEVDRVFKAKEIKEEIVPFFIEQDLLNTVWNKLYVADFIKQNGILFPLGVTNGEDGLFNIAAFSNAKSVYFTNYCGYNYREVLTSATRDTLRKDYFKIALEKYNFDYEANYGIEIPKQQLLKLKSTRLLNEVISLIFIYFNSEQKFIKKYNYIKKMISNFEVQQAVVLYWNDFFQGQSKYKQYILYCIKYRLTFFLFLATSYSNYKNK